MSIINSLKALFTSNAAKANDNAARFRAGMAAQTITVPPANNGPSTYPMSRLTDKDKAYLLRMVTPYTVATHGSAIFNDILTDDAGKTWADLEADTADAGKAFQAQISAIIAYADRLPNVYQSDPRNYSGPLVAVVGAAAAKHVR